MFTNLPQGIIERLNKLPRGLAEHIERARKVGRELAQIHGIDVERVDFALATHDLARAMSDDELVVEANRLGLELTPVELCEPVLIHGAIAACWLEREESVADIEVLEAVRCHTTGAAGMGSVAKAVYLADKLDPGKITHYPFQPKLRELANVDLDAALLCFVNRQIEYFVQKGGLIHPASIEMRNEIILRSESREH